MFTMGFVVLWFWGWREDGGRHQPSVPYIKRAIIHTFQIHISGYHMSLLITSYVTPFINNSLYLGPSYHSVWFNLILSRFQQWFLDPTSWTLWALDFHFLFWILLMSYYLFPISENDMLWCVCVVFCVCALVLDVCLFCELWRCVLFWSETGPKWTFCQGVCLLGVRVVWKDVSYWKLWRLGDAWHYLFVMTFVIICNLRSCLPIPLFDCERDMLWFLLFSKIIIYF